MKMARFRNSNRTLKHIVRSPNLLRKILVPLDQAIRQAISLKKEKSWFPKFPVLAHILCGIFFHIAQLHSLRDLLETLNQKLNSKLLHGFDLKRSTTADANNSPRRLKVIRQVFANLIEQAGMFSRSFSKFSRIAALDSSLLHCVPSAKWAAYRKKTNACKAHLLLDLANAIPKKLILSVGKLHDRKVFTQFLQKGWTYIVDRAYNDYKLFDEMCKSGIFFVTRQKKDASIKVLKRNKVIKKHKKKGVLVDREVCLGSGPTLMEYRLRIVHFKAEEDGKIYYLLTNRFDLSPLTIANLYHARWAIEKFFKWLKRTLRMERGLGRSEVGMEIHVLITLITDILLKMIAGLLKGYQHIPVRILRIIREKLFTRVTKYTLMEITAGTQKE